MDYQLVIQISAESLDDFDALLELEDDLRTAVGDSADVDGHDFGSGEANIFIITSDPKATFDVVRNRLERNDVLAQCAVAHRELDGEEFSVLWPDNFIGEFTVQ